MVGRDHDRLRALHGLLEGRRGGAHARVVHDDIGELAFEQPDQLVGERIALIVGVGLEREAEHGDLAVAQPAEAAFHAFDQEQRDGLVHPRDREQHPRSRRALLREGKVFAQAGPGGQPRLGDPAAGVVAVDQLDHLEDVRQVALAIHHQEVRECEVRVPDDVGPDLRELRLYRRGLDDRGVKDREQLRHDLARACVDAADDAWQRVDLLQEAPGRDALGGMRDENLLADLEATVLGEVAGDELGRPGRHGRAQDERVPGFEHPEQVIEGGADVAHVDLDVRERGSAEREHDVACSGGVGNPVGQRQRSAAADAVEQFLRARLLEGHPALGDRAQTRGVPIYTDHAQAAVGEGQRQR